jgi:hypothetical protein
LGKGLRGFKGSRGSKSLALLAYPPFKRWIALKRFFPTKLFHDLIIYFEANSQLISG